uniref:Fatty acid hydroxylase domain-containing protein 2-like n=1 Tax=Saccoglossus kowalevskii TaxID=10224 RepID=A0ABM0M6F7_SACKO|nr:PREDICTED: fatty acid hydroxylase domain-containing protein 2-like [Saccoglossus kowalevskii]
MSSHGLFVDTWDGIYQLTGKSDVVMFCLGSWLAAFVTYWVVSIPLLCVDLTHRPRFIYQYKMQMDKPIEVAKLKKLFKVVILNQLFYAPPIAWVYYVSAGWRGCSVSSSDLPSGGRILFDLLGCLIFVEVTFYYSHWALHHPFLFKHVHKLHHEWTAPIGLTCIYAHPIEFVFSNFIPVVGGPIVMGSHLMVHWMWFNGNYSATGIMDWLHGTDAIFRDTIAFKRHKILFGTTPMSKKYPDTKTLQ